MTPRMQRALKAVKTMSPQNEFSELHEIAFGMKDWLVEHKRFLPQTMQTAQVIVAECMPDESCSIKERVAEILLAACHKVAK